MPTLLSPISLLAGSAQAGSVDAMWALCLQVAQARRAGAAHWPVVLGSAMSWSKQDGWQISEQWDSEALALWPLLKPMLDRAPGDATWVIAQLGQSLDGCVATRSGDSFFINGPENLMHLHRLRALCDAVIVGVGTVVADNPQLTTRRVPGTNPTRVLLDPRLQLADWHQTAKVFTDGQAPTLWLCDAQWGDDARRLVGEQRVLAVPGLLRADGQPDVALAMAALHAQGLSLLFVEGGGTTVSRFLAQACLDRLHLAVAPLIIGNGRPGLRLAGPERLADCPRPPCRVHPMGADQLWDLDLRALRSS
jgi:diaminohydroxyphosphoribosylaminopyrimidine deaminase/5-amino-6-(5-phosphoribosylamino)uracil reductase